jgi:hypothetical protein
VSAPPLPLPRARRYGAVAAVLLTLYAVVMTGAAVLAGASGPLGVAGVFMVVASVRVLVGSLRDDRPARTPVR